jgi:hypothetical protein
LSWTTPAWPTPPATPAAAPPSNNYAIDSQRPTATIVVADPPSAGETSLVTITFSEAVTGFTMPT